MSHIEAFRQAMRAHGLDYAGPIHDDGKLHRFKPEGDKSDCGWFKLYPPDPVAAGAFGCWKRQIKEKWHYENGHRPDPATMRQMQERWRQIEVERAKEESDRHERMSVRAAELMSLAMKCSGDHLYLDSKKVQPFGAIKETLDGDLILPLVDAAGKLWSVQTIGPLGDKLFMPGGKVQGCMYWVNQRKSGPLIICEGYATGASLFEASGFATVCALNCGNLLAVSRDLRSAYPDREILICADNDYKTGGNPGLTKGTAAATAIKCKVVIPQFPTGLDVPKTDFNDLCVLEGGIAECRIQVLIALGYPLARPIGDLQQPPKDDPEELLKHRYLCRGGGLLVVGPTGIGKSSFVLQMLALLANGMPAFGIEPTRPLKSIYIQAENDDGDIAEIRDGIARGLEFDEVKRFNFYNKVIVHSESASTGRQFFDEVMKPLIVSNAGLDLVVIDPALSFIGAEAKDQRAVGEFLRAMLAPILSRHRLGAIIVHHTNKPPTGNQKAEWTTSEMAYLGSGSIEWANWSRAVLALQSTKTSWVFRLNAAKRGARLSWRNEETQEKEYHKLIKHFKSDKVICWLDADESDIEQVDSDKGGRPRKAELEDFCALVEYESLSSGELIRVAKDSLGISKATFYRLIEAAEEEGKILKSKVSGKWTFVRKKE